MIDYNAGYWGFGAFFQWRGSVAQKGLWIALPNAIAAIAMHMAIHMFFDDELASLQTSDGGFQMGMGGYLAVMGFLLVFRTQQAYARWWEGCTHVQTTRGEWFNPFSSLIAFSSTAPEKQVSVRCFQQLVARLMSLLFASALDRISASDGQPFEVLDINGMDLTYLHFLSEQQDKMTIVLQWVQQLIVEQYRSGTLDIPAPILSRAFQELSRGVVNINNAQKLHEFPFPFPYSQLLLQALMIQWVTTPLIACLLCEDVWWAGSLSFVTTFFMWSINFVAMEIEDPFGDDANDLPLLEMQAHFNARLVDLLHPLSQTAPPFDLSQTAPMSSFSFSQFLEGAMYVEELGSIELQPSSDVTSKQSVASIGRLASADSTRSLSTAGAPLWLAADFCVAGISSANFAMFASLRVG